MDQNQSPLTWVCECSHTNSQAHTTCEICGLSNPAAQDHIQPQNPQSTEQPSAQAEEGHQNHAAPSTWVCECSHTNSQAHTTCEICGLSNPAAQDHIQPQNPPQSNDQPSPQNEEPQPQPKPQNPNENQQAPRQGIPKFQNVKNYGPVQIVGTYPNTGDLVPKSVLREVISENWTNRDTPLIIISQLGIINQGKSLYANVLNQKLLKGKAFTPFPVGTTTKGLTMFSNPIPLEGDPNTQIVHLDVEGAHGVTNEPRDIQAKALKRLYVLSMLLSSVVIIHLGEKPAGSEITLLSEACETVLLLKSKLYIDLPKIYLLIKEAEDDENYKASIESLRQTLKSQLKDEILQHSELLPRGKLSDTFLKSNPADYSKVDQGYQTQMDRIILGLKDHKKKHPIQPNQLLKISDLPNVIKELGVFMLNNSEYAPYLERSMDYLRIQKLIEACQKHQNLNTEECKALAENPDSLKLTTELFTQQLNATQTKHRTNFLQEAETISQRKLNELPLLQDFMSQFDIGMRISSSEQVFLQAKLKQKTQQGEKEKYEERQRKLAQQQAAAKLEAEKFQQELQKQAREFQQEMDKQAASHRQLIQQYKAQRAKEIAQAQEQQKQRQKEMEAQTAQAKADQQRKEAQLNQEEQKKREEDQRRKAEELEKTKQENQQKIEEEKEKIEKETAETERKAEEQEQQRQEEIKKQEEQEAQEKAQKEQQIQQASQDDSDDDSMGDCCNIF